jgi:hypothetical protein
MADDYSSGRKAGLAAAGIFLALAAAYLSVAIFAPQSATQILDRLDKTHLGAVVLVLLMLVLQLQAYWKLRRRPEFWMLLIIFLFIWTGSVIVLEGLRGLNVLLIGAAGAFEGGVFAIVMYQLFRAQPDLLALGARKPNREKSGDE